MSDVREYNLMDVQRIAEAHLNYSENLQLISSLFKEWQLIEMHEYVKQGKYNYTSIKYKVNHGKIPILILGKTTFIIKKLV